jgi:teneurin
MTKNQTTLFKILLTTKHFVISELCDLDCGPHGHCEGDSCACDHGWAGDYCGLKQCDPRYCQKIFFSRNAKFNFCIRCADHGQCKNGTCLCVTGWNGRHCTLEGCPSGCSSHGQCKVNSEGDWECKCYDGWDGTDCSVALESNCNDAKDNDKGNFLSK